MPILTPASVLTTTDNSLNPAGPRGRWRRLLRWTLTAVAILTLLGLTTWWFTLTQIVPKIDQWREPLARQATLALGVPVKIGRVTGHAEGWWPELTLEQVQLLDAAGQVALNLPRVTARLSPASLWPSSLWKREVRLDRLVLVKPELAIRRDTEGRLFVAGLLLSQQQGNNTDTPALDWLLDQGLIRIDQGSVTWTDDLRSAGPLRLTQVDLAIRNQVGLGGRIHRWRLAATPPSAFGHRFELQADLTQPVWAGWRDQKKHRPGDWQGWSGILLGSWPHVDVQSLGQHTSLPFDIQGGRGRLSARVSIKKGQPREVVLDVDVNAVSMRLAPDLKPLAFRHVTGHFVAQHQPTETRLAWDKLRFTTDDGLDWPASQARLHWRHPASPASAAVSNALLPELRGQAWHLATEGGFETDRVDIALVARLADRLPLAKAWREQLRTLAPSGVAQALHIDWKGPLDHPTSYQARGQLQRVSWQSAPEHPGLAGAELHFKASERGGEASVVIRSGWMEFPGAFEEPRIPLHTMDAKVRWRIGAVAAPGQLPPVTVEIPEARFANDDAQGDVTATWRTGSGEGVGASGRYPGNLGLKGRLSRANGARVWRYLPATMLRQARHYVRDAVREGHAENVTFEATGSLWHFPFKDDRGGKFRINVPVMDATLDYVPGAAANKPDALVAGPSTVVATAPYWPPFTKLNGQLIFEGQRLRIEGATATLGGVGSGGFVLRKVSGRIEDLGSADPELDIRGQGEGPLNDLLRYAAVSPVAGWTGHMLSEAQGTGKAGLSLALHIPVNHVERTTLKGQVTMAEGDQAAVRLGPQVPLLQRIAGKVEFTQDVLKVDGRAMVWGQPVQISGGRDAAGVPRFIANGHVSAEGLRTATEWPALAALAHRMSGRAPVTVSVALNRVRAAGTGTFSAYPELQVSSTLQGLELSLPAPLTKEASASWPIKVLHRTEVADGKTDTLQGELHGAALIKAEYQRDLSGLRPRVLRGALSLTESSSTIPALSLPPSGVVARVVLPALDVDAWLQVGAQLRQNGHASAASAVDLDAIDDFVPNTLSLKAGSVLIKQRSVRDVSATLAHPSPGVWRAQIEARQLAGQIEVRTDAAQASHASEASTAAPGSRVVARLSRMSIPASDAQALEEQAAEDLLSPDTTSVPALDIVVDQFEWRGLPLGKLEVEAVNRLHAAPGNAPLPEWRMTKFRLGNPDAQLNATGNWAALGAQYAKGPGRHRHRAAFGFSLDLANTGALLTRLGLPQTLRGGKGKLSGQVSWLGSPLEPDPASMSGNIDVAINGGQFLKAEPGVAKLLGVLSLQSLPRRLALDFRDVFQQGFAFDQIDGDVKITQGVATTRNLRMRGVQALVLMEGQADLAQESQNLRVFVVPEINAGTASLAYAVINPAIGLGTFIAQVLLRKAVVEASTREFTIKGSWADPQVERMQRTGAVPFQDDNGSPPASAVKATQTPS